MPILGKCEKCDGETSDYICLSCTLEKADRMERVLEEIAERYNHVVHDPEPCIHCLARRGLGLPEITEKGA